MSSPWLQAVRPKTLSMAVIPVLLGAVVAHTESALFKPLLLSLVLLAALLIQIGTNLYNDVGDAERGADGPDRLGPKRMVAAGVLSAGSVRKAAILSFFGAFVIGVALVVVGGLPIIFIGLSSIAAGIAYTGGRLPIAYTFMGELFVFLFFGVVAVMGTTYLITLQWSSTALLVGSVIGLLAAAVLVVNNYRDIDTDRAVGKNTLAVTLGAALTRVLYLTLLLTPFLVLLVLSEQLQKPLLIWVMMPALPVSLYLGRKIYLLPHGRGLNQLLAQTAQLQLLFGILMMFGLYL
ncbi:MAG: 1,4-dihydroxy-2-naphthoate polyprenyltransferase [Gammaproteobacteria bacterium]|uniref:1,4-dihydroxy-2-naphthoate octaprenyltransferase n=1 Tax=Candidatus Thiopontia autotrophica TaxID=2841688 RepID=A0A8J6TSE8_9GAMM|nr:1,4-dihydroxy-2-naphthoate polyprenyltransferase [Candidatus Thiopontia autotrophica]MBL6969012.1 1,4-dihydroxy-2-naphthoate polyprenyltransferase [Gammaproteobacteria bacterium]